MSYHIHSDPFTTDWLVENRVTADECYDLSMVIANSIIFYLNAPLEAHLEAIMRECGLDENIIKYTIAHYRVSQSLKKLKKITLS